jgi:hypothetical protein
MMRMLANALLVVGGMGFLIGAIEKVAGFQLWFIPQTYWRGAVGCAAFAIALILMEIRDRAATRA